MIKDLDELVALLVLLPRRQCRNQPVDGTSRPLSAEASLALFRGAQEALTNISRYAPGATTAVTVSYQADRTVVTIEDHRPDVVLMDLRMPGTDGIAATADLRQRLPATRVLVLTTYADEDAIVPALQAGARGYLTRTPAPSRSRPRSTQSTPGRPISTPPCRNAS